MVNNQTYAPGPKETLVIEPLHQKRVYLNNGEEIGKVKNILIDIRNHKIQGIYVKNEEKDFLLSNKEIISIIKNKIIIKPLQVVHKLLSQKTERRYI